MNVYISATLRNFFGKNARLESAAVSIKELLDWLKDEYPESGKVLFDENGKLRSFIRIYVGEDDRTSEEKWDEPWYNQKTEHQRNSSKVFYDVLDSVIKKILFFRNFISFNAL